jgi:hypothetical protein
MVSGAGTTHDTPECAARIFYNYVEGSRTELGSVLSGRGILQYS